MATLQEINAKRKELMGTGQFANEKEAAVAARNQLTSVAPTTGAGATPTPPTPAPSPTLATNQAQLAENQANRAMNPMAQTPPITGSGAVAPITPVTPTVPNPLPTVNALGGTVENRQNTRNVVTGKGATETPSGALLDAN